MIIIAEMTVIGRREIIATVQSPGPGPLDVTDRLVPTETIPGTGIVTAILRIDIETNARPEVIEIRNAGNRDHPTADTRIANTATISRETGIVLPMDLVPRRMEKVRTLEHLVTMIADFGGCLGSQFSKGISSLMQNKELR